MTILRRLPYYTTFKRYYLRSILCIYTLISLGRKVFTYIITCDIITSVIIFTRNHQKDFMPTERKIQRDDIIKVALDLLKTESLDDLTTRQIAEQLNCSVQPIFYNFDNMDELRQAAVSAMHDLYQAYMIEGAKQPQAYRGMGMAYIKFARDFPNYFRILFASQSHLTPEHFIDQDSAGNHIIEAGRELTGFSDADQRKFHLKVWIFTHGLATLVANGTVIINDTEVEQLLRETVHEMIIGAKHER